MRIKNGVHPFGNSDVVDGCSELVVILLVLAVSFRGILVGLTYSFVKGTPESGSNGTHTFKKESNSEEVDLQ